MAICTLCGKRLGIMESINREFADDNKGVCLKCHHDIRDNIKPDIDKLIGCGKSQNDIREEIVIKYAKTDEAKDYLTDYIKSIMVNVDQVKESEAARQFQIDLQKKAYKQMTTTGYSFDGYRIVEYKGIISGESVVGTGFFSEFLAGGSDLLGIESNSFSGKMRQVKQSSLTKLKVQSVLAGGNAVIGVDFDYLTFANNMIGISANGTAVVIEKIEE